MTFKEFIKMDEHKWNNHGGDRMRTMSSHIRKALHTSIKPYMGIRHYLRNKKGS
jgi:hypothetical protein